MNSAAPTTDTDTTPRHPAIELLARYRAIFKAAWQHRTELAGPARLADEQAFLPAALSLQETPVHPAPRRIAFALMALFVIALVWAIFGKIDIVAVAPGRIIVSDRTKLIQPLERSVVQRILVKDGDHVAAGQPLVELDPTIAQADIASLMETRKAAQSEWLRTWVLQQMLLKQELSAHAHKALAAKNTINQELHQASPADWTPADKADAQAQLATEWSDITARLAKLSAEHQRRQAEMATVRAMIAKLEATLPIARQREQDFQALTTQGFMSGHANQDRTRERIELERDLATQQARYQEAQAALREAQEEVAIPPEAVEVIGVLPPVDSVTGFQVTPVVGIIPPDLHYHASQDEVSAVFEMPLAEALRLGRYHPLDIHRRGNDHRVWLSWYQHYFVWGMTAGIIRELALQIGTKP